MRSHRGGIPVVVILGCLLGIVPATQAEVEVEGRVILFYSDDIGIFSASRRLSRDGDPTQPALDSKLIGQGSDLIVEPKLDVGTSFHNRYGTTTIDIRGQGFIYADNPRFNHGTLRLQAIQAFSPDTRIRLRYFYAPNLLLGENEERRSGTLRPEEEILTSHIWAARVEREVTPGLEVRLLARYGLRRYNEDFRQRDTDFWTVGPHLEWRVHPQIKLGLSYHYERGLADGRHQPQFRDDVSYVNHYLSGDLDVELLEGLTLMLAFHYERNNWTSGIVGDERNGGHEDVYQGEVILVRRVTERVKVFAGVQQSRRKQSFEPDSAKNTNVGVGVTATF